MKKLFIVLLLIFLAIPALAQNRGRLSSDDQRRFDSYYQRWLDYKRTNNRDEIISMEKRMQDVMEHNNIPASTPYAAIASNGYKDNYGRYRGKMSQDDQRRFDSYYSRWQDYKRTSNWDEVRSMEGRMREVMQQYDIPSDVPFEQVVSSGGYGQGAPQYRGDLRILNASYGNGFRVDNVTARLQEMVRSDQLSVYVDNDSMGHDPAPGMRKTLSISYSYRGRTQSVTVNEGRSVTIP